MSSPPIVEELNRNDEWVAVHDTEKQDGGLQQGLSRPKAELSNLSTKQVKQLLIAHGVDCSDCVEKDDLVDRLVRAEAKIVPHKFSGAISPPPASGTTSDNSSLQQVGIFKSIPKGLGRSFRKVVKLPESNQRNRGLIEAVGRVRVRLDSYRIAETSLLLGR